MMYLIIQTWLFLAIAWLVGIAVGFGLARDQKTQRHREVEEELRDARNRTIALEKDVDDFRIRVAELEGLPLGARASRVAARDEMVSRMTTLERELETARTNERKFGEEAERLRVDIDGFRTRYLEARAKWDEYQAKAEALASAPAPLNLGEALVVEDDSMRKRVIELEGLLTEAAKARERAADQARTLGARVADLEGQVASAGRAGSERGNEQAKALNARIAELEAQLAAAPKGVDQAGDKTKVLTARVAELEGRLATGINAARETDALKSRIADLQDKLAEAEKALSKSIGVTKQEADPLRARIVDLEAQLTAARAAPAAAAASGEAFTLKSVAETNALRARLSEVEGKLAEAQRGGDGAGAGARARITELEQALERARKQAGEAQSLRAQVTSLEARLTTAEERGGSSSGEDVALLKARLADVEARLMSSSSSSMEFESLRSRVMTLEALLHEAAKSRDEAAILRSKVAELDGRLGQAMKAVAETRSRAEGEKV
jgi:chromosome segregation ATPase